MERSDSTFVIFQFGDGNTENIRLSLPSVLQRNPESGNPPSATPSTATTSPQAAAPDPSQPTPDTDDPNIQRNMLLSVSYIYSQDSNGGAVNSPGSGAPDRERTGTLLLNVPDIPSDRTHDQFNAMVEFAASIALTAIAVSGLRNNRISDETFEKFPLVEPSESDDKTCPICFEDYLHLEKDHHTDNKDGSCKRKREDDEADNEWRKVRKTEEKDNESCRVKAEGAGSEPNGSKNMDGVNESSEVERDEEPSSSEDFSATRAANEQPASTTISSGSDDSENSKYTHVPVELPCSHKFGRDCLYIWLRSNSTCPLCRQVVHTESARSALPERINLPNITSLLNRGTRDRPVIIFLDRTTNTLTTRNSISPESSNINTAPPSPFNTTHVMSSGGRSSVTSRLLSRLNQPRSDAIFSTGVASRRTRDGVETVNLENTNQRGFEDFYLESRRSAQERMNGGRDRSPYGLFGFNSVGDVLTFASANARSNESTSASSTVASSSETRTETSNDNDNVNVNVNPDFEPEAPPSESSHSDQTSA